MSGDRLVALRNRISRNETKGTRSPERKLFQSDANITASGKMRRCGGCGAPATAKEKKKDRNDVDGEVRKKEGKRKTRWMIRWNGRGRQFGGGRERGEEGSGGEGMGRMAAWQAGGQLLVTEGRGAVDGSSYRTGTPYSSSRG